MEKNLTLSQLVQTEEFRTEVKYIVTNQAHEVFGLLIEYLTEFPTHFEYGFSVPVINKHPKYSLITWLEGDEVHVLKLDTCGIEDEREGRIQHSVREY